MGFVNMVGKLTMLSISMSFEFSEETKWCPTMFSGRALFLPELSLCEGAAYYSDISPIVFHGLTPRAVCVSVAKTEEGYHCLIFAQTSPLSSSSSIPTRFTEQERERHGTFVNVKCHLQIPFQL